MHGLPTPKDTQLANVDLCWLWRAYQRRSKLFLQGFLSKSLPASMIKLFWPWSSVEARIRMKWIRVQLEAFLDYFRVPYATWHVACDFVRSSVWACLGMFGHVWARCTLRACFFIAWYKDTRDGALEPTWTHSEHWKGLYVMLFQMNTLNYHGLLVWIHLDFSRTPFDLSIDLGGTASTCH